MSTDKDKVAIAVTGIVSDWIDGENRRAVDLQVELPLRDLFAAFALAGLSSLYPQGGLSFGETVGPMAYELADAALKARDDQ